jgi:tRNA (mo5U34)-methyltransferase
MIAVTPSDRTTTITTEATTATPPAGAAGPSATREQIAALAPWFHNLHLPHGVQTFPDHYFGDFPAVKFAEIASAIPPDLTGWSCLDIGCNAGFYTFQLAARGARVLGIDSDEHYLRQARWAAQQLAVEDRVRFERMQVYDLARHDEQFDLVLFLGVLYHLRYPMLGLDIVCRKVRRRMLFQTLTTPGDEVLHKTWDRKFDDRELLRDPGWPKVAFFEHGFAGDPTNWWAPNGAACEAMLRSAGMRVVGRPGHEFYLCEPDAQRPSCVTTWNATEFLAATGQSPASNRR